MLPVCSAAPCSPFHHLIISRASNRMIYPLRKVSEYRFCIDGRQFFYVGDGNHVPAMYFKTKAIKFIYSDVMEKPDLSACQGPSIFPPDPNDFDDILGGFPNEYIDKEHESWSCLASDINSSCHPFDDLKYVEDSDVLGSYVQNHGLGREYFNEIKQWNTPLEALASQNMDPSIIADSKVEELSNFPDSLDQHLIGLSTFASSETFSTSDATIGTSFGSSLVIPNILEVVYKESSDLQENVGSFFSAIKVSADKLQDKADKSMTTAFNAWTLSLSDWLKSSTETYDKTVSSLFSSIDNSMGQSSNQLTGFSIKLEKGLLKAGSVVVDILRWTIIGVQGAISNGVTFVVYTYESAKTFLPPDIRNLLNIFEDGVNRSLSPFGDTLRQVYQAIKEIERNLGLNPNDPLIPFLLLVGTTTAVGISYWLFRYDKYSLSAERTSELLKNTINVVLVDVRPEAIRERDGIPDLRREARSKYATVGLLEIDNSVRKQLKGNDVDNAIIAVVIRNLKNIKKGTKIIIMDSDTGRSKFIVRSLQKLGVKEPFFMEGGFQSWTTGGLRFKKPKSETALTVLNEEVEAIFEDIKPSPVQIIGYGLGALVAIYALLEWEKTLQIIGIFCIGQALYRRFASYEDSEDLRRDIRSLLAPVTLGANAIYWVAGKLEPKRLRLPTTPLSTAVQDRVLQAAAKHESQPSDAGQIQGQAPESSSQ